MSAPRPLKVLQLGTSGPLYGAERWILALVRNLDPALVESHIAVIDDAPGAPVPLLDEAARLGICGHRIDAPGKFSLKAVQALRELVRGGGFDIVHSHGYKPDLITLLALRGTGAKALATPHGWSRDAGLKLRMYEALDRALFRWFDAVAPLSPELEQGLVGRTKYLRLIPNGVDLSEVDEAATTPDAVLALRAKGPVIGYAGQLITRKDIAALLDGFARWNRPDASLVLVGEGAQRGELEDQARALGIAGQVHFAGFRPDRLAWMRGFDLFVLPSREEGIPRCLMEAMALGLPVVASDIPGNRDLVIAGETGLMFTPGSASELAAAIPQALEAETARRFGAAGRQRIEDHFSGRAMARGYEALFAELTR